MAEASNRQPLSAITLSSSAIVERVLVEEPERGHEDTGHHQAHGKQAPAMCVALGLAGEFRVEHIAGHEEQRANDYLKKPEVFASNGLKVLWLTRRANTKNLSESHPPRCYRFPTP